MHRTMALWGLRLRRGFASRFVSIAQLPRLLFYRMASSSSYQGKPVCHQPLQVVGHGRITFEDDVKLGFFPSPFFFSTYAFLEARSPSSAISIGRGTWINNNFAAIAAHTSITIGRECLIGFNVEILDSDFHGIRVHERRSSRPEWAKPVSIGNKVFIGSNVKIMKGTTIGAGSVIANGSIVVNDVPPGVVAGGNHAKVLKIIEH